MSATNETNTIGLSQYISTDKPTYLVDYNGDMLKIDNAIAADRGSIADVNTVAERADGKADTNKSSIDTLNEQINGDSSVPSDTGLAGKVNTIDGNVNTINSLIGNGAPTTSDQTIIGAVNGLEGSLAPREDGADLANSYAIGEQFARGGSVYTALTSLTAGTAFASLTLNTDYKVSDTLVEQIDGAVAGNQTLAQLIDDKYLIVGYHEISVTADGVKTVAELLSELFNAFVAYSQANPTTYFVPVSAVSSNGSNIPATHYALHNMSSSGQLQFTQLSIYAGGSVQLTFIVMASTSGSTYQRHSQIASDGTVTYTDQTSDVPAADTKLSIKLEMRTLVDMP